MSQNFKDNTLYEMDNLIVLRGMNSETIDLIATDPPFNIKRNRSGSAGHYVDNWKWGDTGKLPDQWKWNEVHPKWLEEIKDNHVELYHAIEAAKHCQDEDTAAFLCFISVRLLEMHRILKPTGSIYLHCDPTASHYIKMCMDAIFGKKNFVNEVVWFKGYRGTPRKERYQQEHETLFFYSKTDSYTWNDIFGEYKDSDMRRYNKIDEEGQRYALIKRRRANGEVYYGKTYPKGKRQGDVIEIPTLASTSSERTGSPDQKPLSLYKRIVKASSNEGGLVLDPFCGCATTIIAAKELGRRWIGVDRRVDARYHIVTRLMGITRKERTRIEKFAEDEEWLNRQTQQYEMHYEKKPPTRTDTNVKEIAELPHVYSVAEPENLLTHAEMREILVEKFGLKCWGCNYIPPDKRYLHLDHIIPKSDGGSNDIDNRALLCQPCNSMKSNTMSLTALRRQNAQEEYTHDNEPLNLQEALRWTREHMMELVRRSSHQYKIDF